MNRRSFMTALAGLPIVGWGAGMFGLPKPTEKSGITVHGPELIVIHDAYSMPVPTVSLRFKNVPLRSGNVPMGDLVKRLHSIGGIVNRSDWHWYGDPISTFSVEKGVIMALPAGYDAFQLKDLTCRRIERARTLMFTDFGFSQPENGLTSVMCAFTPASDRPPWPGSHRPVDFETEILKALTAG